MSQSPFRSKMEQLRNKQFDQPVRVLVMDFDGTLSTLRHGWEQVMAGLMEDVLGPEARADIQQYIEDSAGIQTIYQMKWLRERVLEKEGEALDAWAYKDLYNDRLMLAVERKRQALLEGVEQPEDYLMAGSLPFLRTMREKGLRIHVASGTDQPDVQREAALLGVLPLVDSVAGAPLRQESCSKEKVLRDLIAGQGLSGPEVCVIGDGRVEIALGEEFGARTLGLASDEERRRGINPVKYKRLQEAGAEAITGDFLQLQGLIDWMNLGGSHAL